MLTNGAGHYLILSSSVLSGNSADKGYGAGMLSSSSDRIEISHSTIYGNTTTDAAGSGGLLCTTSNTGFCAVTNSIFWDNTNVGLFLTGSDNYMDSNDYGTIGGDAPTQNSNNFSTSPKFVDAGAGNFHLGNGSPLIGASFDFSGPQSDPEGHRYGPGPYGRTDIGTYAETIFVSGLGDE